jgi:cytochrome c oxidase cbb3-type subunit I/II
MWKQFTADGFLLYPNFLETVTQIIPMYMLRSVGGLMYFAGMFLMVYNLMKTAAAGSFMADEAAEAPALEKNVKIIGGGWHQSLERKPVIFTGLALVAILIGGAIEMIPTFLIKSNIPTIASVKPYTPLELHGRDIYIREGCNTCHSQMIRPFRSETQRYGEYSKAGEFVYDHPFLWGSKRTGPDLHREGGKYPDSWHYHHMLDPRSMSPGSIMPPYPWLMEQMVDRDDTGPKINTLRSLGVPYEEGFEDRANDDMDVQSAAIAKSLQADGISTPKEAEIVALIAYLQRLGTDIKAKDVAAN